MELRHRCCGRHVRRARSPGLGRLLGRLAVDVPFQGDVITPTCDPSLLSTAAAPNAANTYFNQLGCSISRGVATTPQSATSFLFVAGNRGGLFSIPLTNVANPAVGGTAGKVPGPQNYYAAIPEGQKLTNASVSKDGRFAIATSMRRSTAVYACLNPLGDPGDPLKPIDPGFVVPSAAAVKCMLVGSNGLQADLTNAFGPDGQPYFAGRVVVNSFGSFPGGAAASAWPQCIYASNGAGSLANAFARGAANGCGSAQSTVELYSPLLAQPSALITHAGTPYMYIGPLGGVVFQVKVSGDSSARSGLVFRPYATGFATPTTGLGIAEDLRSLMVFSDPSRFGLAGREVVTRLPLCEDM